VFEFSKKIGREQEEATSRGSDTMTSMDYEEDERDHKQPLPIVMGEDLGGKGRKRVLESREVGNVPRLLKRPKMMPLVVEDRYRGGKHKKGRETSQQLRSATRKRMADR